MRDKLPIASCYSSSARELSWRARDLRSGLPCLGLTGSALDSGSNGRRSSPGGRGHCAVLLGKT